MSFTAKVTMYATRFCPFCVRARGLLEGKGVEYKEIAVDGRPELRTEMTQKSGQYTVPQIWVGKTHVGGCDELVALEASGELDTLLQSSEAAADTLPD
ncbi:MAG: glutaredoxin 3 [Exilibacterium sp.]